MVMDEVNRHGEELSCQSDEALRDLFRRIRSSPQSFPTPYLLAAVREAARRGVGLHPFDVQILGLQAVVDGCIAEMRTGEGKTLVAAMAACIWAIRGMKTYVVTVNDYLARRDADWMKPLFDLCSVTVGCITSDLSTAERREEYSREVIYCSNHELAFDYLRDNLALSTHEIVQGKLEAAIIDEIDTVLIDEAQTPLIIAGIEEPRPGELSRAKWIALEMMRVQSERVQKMLDEIESGGMPVEELTLTVARLRRADPSNPRLLKILTDRPDLRKRIARLESKLRIERREEVLDEGLLYVLDEKIRSARLTTKGDRFTIDYGVRFGRSPEGWRLYRNIVQIIRAYKLFRRDVDYIVRDGRVIVVDEFTGRAVPDKRFEGGLHPALECKEDLPVRPDQTISARITYPAFFKLFRRLAGLTGTASPNADEFHRLYGLRVVRIPTNRPVIRIQLPDASFKTESEKLQAAVEEVERFHRLGVPILIGTRSVEMSERVSSLLNERRLPHVVLNAKNHAAEAEIVKHAGEPYKITVATNMAGRGTDIRLHPDLFRIVTDNYVGEIKRKLDRGYSVEVEVFSEFERSKLREGLEGRGIPFRDEGDLIRIGEGEKVERIRFHLGLYVIGTERHEARRIDDQLVGRSGRQGDPGAARFFVSLEDELVRLYGRDLTGEEEISQVVFRAQRAAEEVGFAARTAEMRYDRAIAPFRERFYSMRRRILFSQDISAEIEGIIKRVSETLADEPYEEVMGEFLVTREEIKNIAGILRGRWKETRRRYGDMAGEVERRMLLESYDEAWSEFLTQADEMMISRSIQPADIFHPESQLILECSKIFENLIRCAEREFLKRITLLAMPRHRRAIILGEEV
jgi:preprotein translocase subunit SecA